MKEKFFKSNFSPKRLSVYLSICLSILGIGNANAQTTLSETFNWEANCGIGDATGSARVYLSDEGQFTFIQTKIGSGVSIASNANYMQLTSSQTLDVFSTDADRVITSVVITTSSTTTMGYMSGASVKASTSLASYASASVISPTITTDGTAFVVTYDFDYENGYKYLQIQSTGTARIYKIEVKYAVNTDYYYKLYSITDFTDVTAFSTTNAQTNPTTSNVQTKTTPNNAISAISNVGTVQMTNKGGLKIGANNNNSASLSVTLLQTTDRVVIVGTGYANGNTAFTFNGNSSPFDSYSPNNMAEYSLCYLKDTKVFDMSPAANNFTLGNNSSNRNVIYRIYTFQKVYLPSSCTTPPSLGTVVEGEAPTSNSVSLMAELAYQVDCAVTEYGFVYNTTGNPTIADNKVTSSDLDDDIFSKEVTGLTCGTAYYFRAYAINGAGISYSEQYNASTAAPLYSVTLNNAGVTSQLSQTSCDETLTLPPATPPCAGWEFAGWTETNVSQITVTPTFITEYTPSANGTVFYAVFSKVAVTLPNYTSPTSTANKFVIAAKIGTTYYAIPSDYTFTLSTYGRINSTVVETLENNGSVYVNFDAGGYAWIIQSTASGFKITNTDGSKYLAYNSSTYLQITTTAQYWTITDGSTGLLRITNQTTIDRGLGFNKDSDQLKFGCYAVSNLNNATSGYCDIELLPVSEQTVTYSSTPLCPAVLTWTGVTTDWTTASNWSPAQVPTTIDSVTIAAADVYPAIPENTEVASLTIAPNAEIYNQANLSTNTKVFVQ
ncbi:MAG: hypothetical protein LBB41_05125 [Prevotellaceae bacterium]|jgi:hypothetical protein|nr:hypothetical protein [Prevotellaceae bacterium]